MAVATDLRIIKDFPPNYEAICEAFPIVRQRKGTIFTYGDACYVPYGGVLTYHLRIHELTHVRQQEKIGVVEWWNRYLIDHQFRLTQEAEAYGRQYRAMTKMEKVNNFHRIASDLASPMYGSIVTVDEAKQLIKIAAEFAP